MKAQKITAWTAKDSSQLRLEKQDFPMPELKPQEVLVEVEACGVCHSDLHLIKNDWGISQYPLVPGHEILGKVVALGSNVSSLKLGAKVGIGWQSGSCGECRECIAGKDNLCSFQSATCLGHTGGFANFHVTDARYCFVIPEAIQLPEAAPLLCGGITVYSPLCEFVQEKAAHVGVIGLGGLGHLAVKMAHKMGFEVSVFSSSPQKKAEALQMGAHNFVVADTEEKISSFGRKLDLLLVTANVDLPFPAYLKTLRPDGTLCFVGIPPSAFPLHAGDLLGKRLRVAGSPIGSRSRIREMLEFCATNKITATSELFSMAEMNKVLEKVAANKVRYRAVLLRE